MMAIEVRSAGARGRGVFAKSVLLPGDQIESCPVIVIPTRDLPLIDRTSLFEYYFGWEGGGAIAGGFGSLYNHSERPNAKYEKDYAQSVLTFRALTRIEPGQEITIRYNPGAAAKLWFDPV